MELLLVPFYRDTPHFSKTRSRETSCLNGGSSKGNKEIPGDRGNLKKHFKISSQHTSSAVC